MGPYRDNVVVGVQGGEAAEHLRSHSENTVRRWEERGLLHAVRLPSGVRRFRPDDVEDLDRYLTLLEHVFLVLRLPAWHTNRIKQITKTPKLLLSDSALLTHLLRTDRRRLADDDSLLGAVLECFIGMELAKQLSAASTRASLLHMRTSTGTEVDFILEGADGRLAGIDVKASTTVRGEDFKHLTTVRDQIGEERFVRGVVLYTGSERLPFGERLEARPLATLWTNAGA